MQNGFVQNIPTINKRSKKASHLTVKTRKNKNENQFIISTEDFKILCKYICPIAILKLLSTFY